MREAVSEDCLSLNLWTPTLRDGGKRPVMVYIHGGEYSSGSDSSPIYDGTRLCLRGDVVVVTVNHRLNAFGHLYLSRLAGADYASSGNVGLLDLVLALGEVRSATVVTSAWHLRAPYHFLPWRDYGIDVGFAFDWRGDWPRMLAHELRGMRTMRSERARAQAAAGDVAA